MLSHTRVWASHMSIRIWDVPYAYGPIYTHTGQYSYTHTGQNSSPTNHSSSGAAENQSLNQTASQQEIQQPQQPAMQKSQPSNPSPTAEPDDQYAIMASLKQQQPPPSPQQQAKDTDRIDASQKFYSGDYNTIHRVAKDKEIMGRDNREDDEFIPKDKTVILEDSKMNEIDRELEEFKRFCLMVKPLKNRIQIRLLCK